MPAFTLRRCVRKPVLAVALGGLALFAQASAAKADSYINLSPDAALALVQAHQPTSPVTLYFGYSATPEAVQQFGSFTTTKRTNGLGKNKEEACSRALASGLLTLQSRATSLGGNAVIHIESGFPDSAGKGPVCRIGFVAVEVILKADIVQLGR